MRTQLIAAMDPGSAQTAWVLYRTDGFVQEHGKEPNSDIVRAGNKHPTFPGDLLVVERMVSTFVNPKRGGYIGTEVMDAQFWTGVFAGHWDAMHLWPSAETQCLSRKEIVGHLCGSGRAGDPDVRAALIDRFPKTGLDGKKRPSAIGTKNAPGPLYGIAADEWSALAVAVTYADLHKV